MKNTLAVILCLNLIHSFAYAQEAQDAYDPFIDYNEFEVADEEEADVNFFRHGRLFTAGFLVGQRQVTEGMADVFDNPVVFGLYLSYFFDMRFALQFSYVTGSHALEVTAADGSPTVTGDSDISQLSADLKYYINTQNVTRGLAALNPYLIAGFSSVSRESKVDGQPEFGQDSTTGFNLGAGIEFPMMQNRMYFGLQGAYHLVNFDDENTEIRLGDPSEGTGIYPNGDFFTILGILGVNF